MADTTGDGPEPFGSRVRRLRMERKLAAERERTDPDRWTQTGLAQQSGIGQAGISKIELNGAEPSSETLIALAAVFGIRTDDLIRDTTLDRLRTNTEKKGDSPTTTSVYYRASTHALTEARHHHVGEGYGAAGDRSSSERADVSERAPDAFWARLKDQKQYGRDLIRAADFIGRLGRALLSGEARIVGADRPVRDERSRQTGRRDARSTRAKKPRAV